MPSKKTTAKKEPKKLIEVFTEKETHEEARDELATAITETAEEVEISTVTLPKRYYVQFYKQVQPSESRYDEVVGTIYWSDIKEEILIEGLHNSYASEIENFMEGDLPLANGQFVSRYETPKEWVKSLHKAVLSNGFYAKDFMEIVDETE